MLSLVLDKSQKGRPVPMKPILTDSSNAAGSGAESGLYRLCDSSCVRSRSAGANQRPLHVQNQAPLSS